MKNEIINSDASMHTTGALLNAWIHPPYMRMWSAGGRKKKLFHLIECKIANNELSSQRTSFAWVMLGGGSSVGGGSGGKRNERQINDFCSANQSTLLPSLSLFFVVVVVALPLLPANPTDKCAYLVVRACIQIHAIHAIRANWECSAQFNFA